MHVSNEIMDNPHADRVKRIAQLAQSRARKKSGLFLVEGPQSVRELVTYRPEIIKDIYVQTALNYDDVREDGNAVARLHDSSAVIARILDHPRMRDIYVHYVSDAVMKQISDDAQGIVAVAEAGAMIHVIEELLNASESQKPTTLAAFWQIRDPGNAGTVIRAADAAGCSAVVFVDDCVDALNTKVIRSTAGSLFHIPVIRMSADDFFTSMHKADIPVIAADVHGVEERESESLQEVVRDPLLTKGSHATLFGNEARGLPAEILRKSSRIVYIPMYGKAESLNLATSAAIMLHTLAMSSHVGTI
ncbi:TrmH family RNA methyltransferase [Bifidobacterium aquikefiricola]|uniref:RNA methyltransferase n=1 Tax=Bifidobacterium aquikefiricola TaxID=3059038 RepID=A0AB39U4J8_9BIFI